MPSERYVSGAIPDFGVASEPAGFSGSPGSVRGLHKLLDHDIHPAMATLQERGRRAARRPA
jgi:hypothetical protein